MSSGILRIRRTRQETPVIPAQSRQSSVNFSVEVRIEQDASGTFLVEAIPLGVATFGDTADGAVAAMADALNSYISSLVAHGELVSEFDRLGVEYDRHTVVAAHQTPPHVEIGDATDLGLQRPAFGHALVPC